MQPPKMQEPPDMHELVWWQPFDVRNRSNSVGSGSLSSSAVVTPSSFPTGSFPATTNPDECDLSSRAGRADLPPFPERVIALVALNVLRGLLFLAKNHGRVHGDIKPKNIVASPTDACFKLCDFGFAHRFTCNNGEAIECGVVMPTSRDALHHTLGTGAYKAPERFINSSTWDGEIRYGPLADVYALGLTLLELAGSPPPTTEMTPMPGYLTESMRTLIHDMTLKDPTARRERIKSLEDIAERIEQQWVLKEKRTRIALFLGFYNAATKPCQSMMSSAMGMPRPLSRGSDMGLDELSNINHSPRREQKQRRGHSRGLRNK
jgi:serine/threonine protein kinase